MNECEYSRIVQAVPNGSMSTLDRFRSRPGKYVTVCPLLMVLTLLALPILDGCSIVGFALGSARDAHARDTILFEDLNMLRSGDDVYLLMENGETINGEFVRFERFSTVQNDTASFPGYRITFLSLASGVRRSGLLAAFDDDTLWVRLDGSTEFSMYSVDNVKDIMDEEHQVINQKDLRVMAGKLPLVLQKTLIIADDDVQRNVPANEIKLIRYNRSQSLRWIFLGGGLAVDAAIIGLLSAIGHSFSWSLGK